MWKIKSTYSWGEESFFPKKMEYKEAEVWLDAIARSHHNTFMVCEPPHNRMTISKTAYGGLGWNGGPKAPLIPEYYLRLDGKPYMRIQMVEVEDEKPVDNRRPKRRSR